MFDNYNPLSDEGEQVTKFDLYVTVRDHRETSEILSSFTAPCHDTTIFSEGERRASPTTEGPPCLCQKIGQLKIDRLS